MTTIWFPFDSSAGLTTPLRPGLLYPIRPRPEVKLASFIWNAEPQWYHSPLLTHQYGHSGCFQTTNGHLYSHLSPKRAWRTPSFPKPQRAPLGMTRGAGDGLSFPSSPASQLFTLLPRNICAPAVRYRLLGLPPLSGIPAIGPFGHDWASTSCFVLRPHIAETLMEHW